MNEIINYLLSMLIGAIKTILGCTIAVYLIFNFNNSYHHDSSTIKNDIKSGNISQSDLTNEIAPQPKEEPNFNFHRMNLISIDQLLGKEYSNNTYDNDYEHISDKIHQKADVINKFAAHPVERIIGLNGVSNNPNVYGAPPNSTQIEGLNGMRVY